MENPPFADVFPIQDGDFPLLCLFTGGYKYEIWIYCKQKKSFQERRSNSTNSLFNALSWGGCRPPKKKFLGTNPPTSSSRVPPVPRRWHRLGRQPLSFPGNSQLTGPSLWRHGGDVATIATWRCWALALTKNPCINWGKWFFQMEWS